jgi:hypothetical protein
VQDVTAVGDLLPGRAFGGGVVYWPFIVDEAYPNGLRGYLKNIYFGGDNYLLGSEVSNQLHSDTNLTVGGLKHVLTRPAYFPNSANAICYTPLGNTGVISTTGYGVTATAYPSTELGGPNIIIKKGDGS